MSSEKKGEEKREALKLFHSPPGSKPEEAIQEVKNQGYHLSTYQELRDFRQKDPELRSRCSIAMLLGSVWVKVRRDRIKHEVYSLIPLDDFGPAEKRDFYLLGIYK